jgi:hypothetical protein
MEVTESTEYGRVIFETRYVVASPGSHGPLRRLLLRDSDGLT